MQSLVGGWRIQTRVISALMMRELITRFGRENIGFLWIMAEPLLFAVLVGLTWEFMKGPEYHGVNVIAFVVTGYIPLVMFRTTMGRAVRVFTANGSLLYHRQVTLVDLILVRFIIELIGGTMAFIFIGTILVAVGIFPVPADVGAMLFGWFLYGLFTLSIAIVMAPLSEVSETVEKFVPVTTYLMVPFSGSFSLSSWLSPNVRNIMLYSPPVTGMELMRYGIWGDKITPYYDVPYALAASFVLILVGLIFCRKIRRVLIVE